MLRVRLTSCTFWQTSSQLRSITQHCGVVNSHFEYRGIVVAPVVLQRQCSRCSFLSRVGVKTSLCFKPTPYPVYHHSFCLETPFNRWVFISACLSRTPFPPILSKCTRPRRVSIPQRYSIHYYYEIHRKTNSSEYFVVYVTFLYTFSLLLYYTLNDMNASPHHLIRVADVRNPYPSRPTLPPLLVYPMGSFFVAG